MEQTNSGLLKVFILLDYQLATILNLHNDGVQRQSNKSGLAIRGNALLLDVRKAFRIRKEP